MATLHAYDDIQSYTDYDMKQDELMWLKYALFCAVVENDLEIAKVVLMGKDCQNLIEISLQQALAVDKEMGTNMLHSAKCVQTQHRHFPILKSSKNPILYICCLNFNEEMMYLLLENVDGFMESCSEFSELLYFACSIGNHNFVEHLLKTNTKAQSKDLLTCIANYQPHHANAENFLHIAKLLLESGVSPNESNEEYNHCLSLHMSASKADCKMTLLLLQNGASVGKCLPGSHTPLHVAIKNQRLENIDLLIKFRSDINQCSCHKTSPLSAAVESGNIGILMTLLKLKPDVNLRSRIETLPPIIVAAKKEYLVMVWLMLVYGGNVNTLSQRDRSSLLISMVEQNSLSGAHLVLRYNPDIDLETTLGTTAIWKAVYQNNREIVELLLYVNCRLDITSVEYYIYHPINATMLTLYTGNWDILKILLLSGGKLVNSKIYNPDYMLHEVLKSNSNVFQSLLTWIQSIRPLKSLCREVIRNNMRCRIDIKIKKLDNYPKLLKEYILLKDVLSIDVWNRYLALKL